jgi:hypothetical protein
MCHGGTIGIDIVSLFALRAPMLQYQQQRRPILIAVPDSWRTIVCRIVEHYGFPVLVALSHHEAVQLAIATPLSGIFVISDWVVPNAEGTAPGVVTLVKHRIPTVTLVRPSGDYRWFDVAYERPLHEYFTIPFSVEEVVAFMRSTGMLTEEEMRDKERPEMADLLEGVRDEGSQAE